MAANNCLVLLRVLHALLIKPRVQGICYYFYPPFKDVKIEAQRGEISNPKLHGL